jgi:hypothetical protein
VIRINRAKAEAITRERLRAERAALWDDLDLQALRAIESGQDPAHIAAQKQALRDVTSKPLDGLTLDQLASLTLADALDL